jgi:UDP-glucose 4-epimerase
MQKNRVLVTGGLGFVGSHLVELLARDKNNEVYVIDNLSSESSSRDNMVDGVTYWIDDIRNLNTLKYHPRYQPKMPFRAKKMYEGTPHKFDVIYHLAGLARIQPSFTDPLTYLDVNIVGTSHVLEYARWCGARVVYAGSSSAYGGPMLNPYAFAKYTGEQTCEMFSKVYGISTVSARFFNVYGRRQPTTGAYATVVGVFERQTRENQSLTVTGDGEQRRDFTHVADIARGLVALSEGTWSGEVFNLGTGINYSINELAGMFGGEIRYIPKRPGEAQTTLANISGTTAATGWKPKCALKEYVQKFLADPTNFC